MCFKQKVINHSFSYLPKDSINGYFTIKNTEHLEIVNGALYSKSSVVWRNCNEYTLIVREANYSQGLKVGDTLHVKLLSFKHDTLSYISSGYGISFKSKVIKLK